MLINPNTLLTNKKQELKTFFLPVLFILFLIKPAVAGNDHNIEHIWTDPGYHSELYPDSIYFIAFDLNKKVWWWRREREKQNMIQTLKRDLSQNIHINVRSEEQISISSFYHIDHSYYIERYSSDILIKSDIDLTQSTVKLHYERQERKLYGNLYGIIFIEKSILAGHYLELLLRECNVLENQLANNTSSYTDASLTRNHIDNYENSFNKIIAYSNIIIAAGQSLSGKTTALLGKLRSKIDEVYKHLDYDYYSKKLITAHHQLLTGNYKDSYLNFVELSLIIPGNEQVKKGLSESKLKLESRHLSEISQHRLNKNYHDAILKYDELFALLPDIRQSHLNFYRELEKKAFKHYSQKLNHELSGNDHGTMQMLINRLSLYSHINHSEYLRLKELVDQSLAEAFYQQARIHYHNEKYVSAISQLQNALKLEDARRYSRLDNRARRKVYIQKLRSLKQSRPHKYTLQLGGGIQHNMDLFDYYLDHKDLNISYISAYSAGLYRKFNISPIVLRNGKDYSMANIFGIKYTYTNFKNPHFADRSIFPGPDYNLQELEMVMGLTNHITLSLGIITEDFNMQILPEKEFYTITLSARSYLLPFEFTIDLKGYITENNIYPILKLSTFLNMNFIRQINRHDRREIRYNVSNL